MTEEHICRLFDPWPTGHPLPPDDPAKAQGPGPGTFMVYHPKGYSVGDVRVANEPRIVRVVKTSYVWSPGECRAKGGYRHYDWSVIEEGPDGYRRVVVNDTDLTPLPEGKRVHTVYTLLRSVPAWAEVLEA